MPAGGQTPLVAILLKSRLSLPDLSLTELLVVVTVAQLEGLTVSSVSRLCRLTDATASRTLQRLASHRGLVRIAAGPRDSRTRHAFLTENGRKFFLDLEQTSMGLTAFSARQRGDTPLTTAFNPGWT